MMFTLRMAPDWAEQVRKVREAVTEETRLIRPDGACYRVCHAGDAAFEVRVTPGGVRGASLRLRACDLDVTHLDGTRFDADALRLDPRLCRSLAPEALLVPPHAAEPHAAEPHAAGLQRPQAQALLALCVAGSLRSDARAATLGQALRVATTGRPGASVPWPVDALLQEARTWGAASESVFGAISSTARGIALKRRAELTPLQRHFSEQVELARIDAGLQAAACSLAVLKRPK